MDKVLEMKADSELAIGLLLKSVKKWLILCKIPLTKQRLCFWLLLHTYYWKTCEGMLEI